MKNGKSIPFFSVVIPTLNEEHYLPHLLSDLKAQTYKNFEVIISDANSEDKTVKCAQNFKNKLERLSVYESEIRNVSHQRNLGAKKALSKWIIFLDADDRIPDYFLQGIKFFVEMKKPDILTGPIEADTKNSKDKTLASLINVFIDIQKKTKQPYLLEAFVCVNKRSFFRLGGFDENVPFGEGSKLVNKAAKMNMKYIIAKDLKYIYSLRRVRKQGTIRAIRNVAQTEFARLTNLQLSPQTAKNIYPMEGGKYFEITTKEQNRIIRIMTKFFKAAGSKIEQGNPKTVFLYISKFIAKSLT